MTKYRGIKTYQLAITILIASLTAQGCSLSDTRITPPNIQFAENEVVIKRDSYGTPHIYASDTYSLYYGYGYALASDRLYQLEILKYSTQGRVSEILGADWIGFDTKHQKLFWPDDIRAQLEALPPHNKAVFLGMAEGINARLAIVQAKSKTLLPYEFSQNGFKPKLWSAYDTAMLFVGSMLLRYGDFNTEIDNEQFLAQLIKNHGDAMGRHIFNLVNPIDNVHAPTVISSKEWHASPSTGDSHALILPEEHARNFLSLRGQEFSNALVVSKKYLKNDKAILINGPQFGWYVPAYTYSVGFHTPEWEAVGNAPVGYPLPMFGYNQYITWGSTWGASDNVDIFRETLNPKNLSQYKYKGEWKNLDQRQVVLKVKGKGDVTFTAYKSVHGPITIYEPLKTRAYAKSRGWNGRELSTLIGWIEATKANNHTEWKDAVKKSALNVNWYYADKVGNIAYFAGGAYPKRAPGHDNRFPISGEGHMDWRGIHPAEANPQVLNPSSGYIANWNNKPRKGFTNPDEWWYSWSEADRIHIIDNLVTRHNTHQNKMDADEVWQLMMTAAYIDPNADFFKPYMLDALTSYKDPRADKIYFVLKDWDNSYTLQTGSGSNISSGNRYSHPGNAIFRNWLAHMLKRTLADDLPGDIGKAISTTTGYGTPQAPTISGLNITTGSKMLLEILRGRTDYDFFNGQSHDEVWLRALNDTMDELSTTYGDNISDWQLPVPSTRFQHKNFLGIPQALPNAQIDDIHDMNRGTQNNMTVFSGGEYPSGYEIVPLGQSGFISPQGEKAQHYEDQAVLFSAHGKKPVWLRAEDINRDTISEIRLTPMSYKAANGS